MDIKKPNFQKRSLAEGILIYALTQISEVDEKYFREAANSDVLKNVELKINGHEVELMDYFRRWEKSVEREIESQVISIVDDRLHDAFEKIREVAIKEISEKLVDK